jgi:hypothetical protein
MKSNLRRKMMPEENKPHEEHEEIELYGDPGISTFDKPVPTWLLMTYISLPIWGLITLVIFFNGSVGWLDRGYWHELQVVANTTLPNHNANMEEPDSYQKQRGQIIQAGSQKMAETLKEHKDELREKLQRESGNK